MKSANFSRCALGICVASAVIAGCGAPPLSLSKGQDDTQLPIGAPGSMPQTRAIATHVERGKSWMLAKAKSEDLLLWAISGVRVFLSIG
jgi:hypothetical protein